MARSVLFVEVPSFYALVEQNLDPELRGRPVIVGGDPRKRGLVQAATPDALELGVIPEMPVVEAMVLCPRARLVRTEMPRYRDVSRRFFACLRRVLARPEPLGLAAAYFDLTSEPDPPRKLVERARELVESELSLPLRAGLASGKFLARLVVNQPEAKSLAVVEPGMEATFLGELEVTVLEGVGPRTEETLAELGAETVRDVAGLGRDRLEEALGVHGVRIHALATGVDDSLVKGVAHPKSVSREATLRTGADDGADRIVLSEQIHDLARQLEAELRVQGLAANKITLKLRFADQTLTTRSATLDSPVSLADDLQRAASRLLERTPVGSTRVRGLGIQLAKLSLEDQTSHQLDLFPGPR